MFISRRKKREGFVVEEVQGIVYPLESMRILTSDVDECEPSVLTNVLHDSGRPDIRGGSGERSKHTGENRFKASLFLYLVQVFIYGVDNWK